MTFGYTASVGGVERYNITVDREYDVYGIVMYKGEIFFLVQNDDALLRLYNSRLFKITNNELFCEWGITDTSCLIIFLLLLHMHFKMPPPYFKNYNYIYEKYLLPLQLLIDYYHYHHLKSSF